MIPVSSNNLTNGCNPISSNCVVWQGPDIPCINLCTGDSVSDVVAALATELCTLLDQTSLSNLDLSCLNLDPQNIPSNFSEFQQLIIDELCGLGGRCSALEIGGGGTGTSSSITATLPACLQYTNQQNDLVTVLPIDEYAELIAAKICDIYSSLTILSTTISNHDARITILENNQGGGSSTIPQVTPECVLPAVPTDIDVVVEALEEQFCILKSATGESTALLAATTYQCPGLNVEPALSTAGTMSNLQGWNNTVTSVAESLTNMWLTICDIRAAVKTIQQTCCTFNCNEVLLYLSGNYNSNILTLNFNGSFVPSGFNECNPSGALVLVDDGTGTVYTTRVQVLNALAGNGTEQIDLSASGLNPIMPYTVTVTLCVTDGTNTCEKSATVMIENPNSSCGLPTGITAEIS
jgi:hypothetical protein